MKKLAILIIPLGLWAVFYFVIKDHSKIAGPPPEDKRMDVKEAYQKRWDRSISSEEKTLTQDPKEREKIIRAKKRLRRNVTVDKKFFPEDYKLEHRGSFLISDQLRAAPEKKYNALLGKEIMRDNGYVYYKVPRIEESGLLNSSSHVLPVVMNTNTGLLGVVTGKMVLKLNKGEELEQVMSGHQVKVVYRADHIQSYVIECHDNEDLREFFGEVKQTDGISSAELEIIQHGIRTK